MYENVRVHHFYFHDSNTRFSGLGVHPGCFMMDTNFSGVAKHNLVFDHLVCERVATVGIQLGDSGVTFQNSVFSCPVYGLDQSTPNGKWDQCAPSQYQVGNSCRTDMAPGCVVSNVVFRYNVFIGGSTGLLFQTKTSGPYGTFSNVSVVGNVFGASLTCGMPGISYDANTFLNGVGTCGTNATSLGAGDPFVQSSTSSPGNSWSAVSLLDAHPDGSPTLPTIALGNGDLNLDHDADGAPRSATTRPGAYN